MVRDGQLAGIIDWSLTGIGDPACDAMVAWSMPPDAREVFIEGLGVDAATVARARGWVIQQAVPFIPYYARTLPETVALTTQRLVEALADDIR